MSNDLLAIGWWNAWRLQVDIMKSGPRTAWELERLGFAACAAQSRYVMALALSGVRAD